MKQITIKKDCTLQSIITFESFEYMSDLIYKNEYHNCWMLYYVEKGGLELSFSNQYNKNISVSEGHIFIQPPQSDYSYRALPGESTQVFNIGFLCDSRDLHLISSSDLAMREDLFSYWQRIKEELKNSFHMKRMSDGKSVLEKTLLQPYGGEQYICNLLELLFLDLIRYHAEEQIRPALSPEQIDSLLFRKITRYYTDHINSYLSLEEICSEFNIGQAHLQRIFRTHTEMGAIEYFCNMRIDAAKKLMREEGTNLHETASRLGYHTVHYFSKQFKQIEGIAPSKYMKMLQSTNSGLFQKEVLS